MAAMAIEMTIRQIMNSCPDSPVTGIKSGDTAGGDAKGRKSKTTGDSSTDRIYHRTDQIQKVVDFLLTNFIESEHPNGECCF